MINSFTNQFKNTFLNRSITNPLISKGSMLMGKTNMFSGMRKSLNTDLFNFRKKPITPITPVNNMVKESSLFDIFNNDYFQQLFEFTSSVMAPIGGQTAMQSYMNVRRLRNPRPRFNHIPRPRFNRIPGQTTVRQSTHNPLSATPIHPGSGHGVMGSVPPHWTNN